jgi:hypothetical protein
VQDDALLRSCHVVLLKLSERFMRERISRNKYMPLAGLYLLLLTQNCSFTCKVRENTLQPREVLFDRSSYVMRWLMHLQSECLILEHGKWETACGKLIGTENTWKQSVYVVYIRWTLDSLHGDNAALETMP